MAIVKGPVAGPDGSPGYELRLQPEEVEAAYLIGFRGTDFIKSFTEAMAAASEIARFTRSLGQPL